MDRRELIKRIAMLTGGAFVGAELFMLGGCTGTDKSGDTAAIVKKTIFGDDDVIFLNEVGEIILPATKTPGAKAANVGQTITVIVNDCYEEKEQKIFKEGIAKLNDACKKMHNTDFLKASSEQRNSCIVALDKEAKAYMGSKEKDAPTHYFTMMKQLVLACFFSSKVGATEVLRYVAVPGSYQGSIDYKKGDRAWAT